MHHLRLATGPTRNAEGDRSGSAPNREARVATDQETPDAPLPLVRSQRRVCRRHRAGLRDGRATVSATTVAAGCRPELEGEPRALRAERQPLWHLHGAVE